MKSLFVTSSIDGFHRTCSILDNHQIKYKYNKISHNQNTLLPGRGTTRSFGGNLSNDVPVYEILVDKKDYELGKYLIRNQQ